MNKEEKATLIEAIEIRKKIAITHEQGFVDLTFEMVDKILAALKETTHARPDGAVPEAGE